jgi:ADP-ribose pyrophosphatase
METGRRVEIENRRLLLDDFLKVEEAVVRYEQFDGGLSRWVRRLRVDRGDSVAALLFNVDTQRLLLVDQFKFPTLGPGSGWIVETVAGGVEEGESPIAAIRREVREEMGYDLAHVDHIATFYVSPGGSSERIFLYYGEVNEGARVGMGGGLVAEDEDIQVREYTYDEACAALDAGELVDAKTIIALQWLRGRMGSSG